MEGEEQKGTIGSEVLEGLDLGEADALSLGAARGGIITARGTAEGLIVRLDGRVDRDSLKDALEEFLISRKAFLSGQEVSLEWVGAKPDESVVQDLTTLLSEKFTIKVRASRMREHTKNLKSSDRTSTVAEEGATRIPFEERFARAADSDSQRRAPAAGGRSLSLFDGMGAVSDTRFDPVVGAGPRAVDSASSGTLWDDADARVIYATLRSGQKIETDHTLVIFGDVNSGAEIIAGGDIIVLGTLRGVAHAGAYDETGGGRMIFALNLQATQLRIGMVISRGSSEGQRAPEIARVEGGLIVVEPYASKNLSSRRRE